MKSLSSLLIVILLIFNNDNSFSQTLFSTISCENLEGKTEQIPIASERNRLLIFTFGKSNEKDLKTWLQPVYEKFIEKSGLLDFMFDVDLSLISVLNTLELSAAKANKEKIKQEIDKELHAYIYLYKGDEAELLKALNNDKKQLTVLLLDASGKILFKSSGKFDDDKMEAIEDLLD